MADNAGKEAPKSDPSDEKEEGTEDTDDLAQQFDGVAESLKGVTKNWSELKAAEGIMAAMFSGVLITVASIYTRLAGDQGMPAIHAIFMNELMAAIVYLPIPFLLGAPITGNTWTTVIMLVILGVGRMIAFICFFVSVLYIPPANSFVIRHGIIPLLTASMEVVFLRVAPSVAEWVGIGLSIIGVILTASGRSWLKEDEELYLNILGNMLAVISAFGLAGLIIMTRYLLKTLPIWTLLFYIKLIGIVIALPLLFLDPPFTSEMNYDLSYYLVAQGFLYTVGIGIMFHSLTLENASTVALPAKIVLSHCLDVIQVFVNSYLMLSHKNRVAVIASHTSKTHFLYPKNMADPRLDQRRGEDGRYEQFATVDDTVVEEIKQFMTSGTVVFLRVAPSVAEWVGIGLSIIGVILTASGRSWLKEDEELYLNILGNMLAVISAFGLAGLIIMTRYLLKTLPIWTLLFYIKLIGIVIALPLLFLDPPFTSEMNYDLSYYLVAQGFLYTVGIGIMFHSLTLENASTVALVKNISILVAFVLERYVLHIIPTIMELLGAILVIGSTTVVAIVLWFKKWKEQRNR
uniref:General transcription factor IIH subunit 3 n=1 Tax=Branchiostoma floridae TaxID=7739 RepID=C3YD69_BRAFL|eukprot:XP_002605670.1 hypothetical protein BRAFLDRAFT_77919 [Branchiostoma floridae]